MGAHLATTLARIALLLPIGAIFLGGIYFAVQSLLLVLGALPLELNEALPRLIKAVEVSLLSATFFIFSLGLFELFIRSLPETSRSVFFVQNLSGLKNRLGEVIITLLLVIFFERVLFLELEAALDYLLFAAAVLLLAAALWLLRRQRE
ncbi:YqhA family protein [Thermus thermamylovorans]|uniref:YqhA family protein n=1 Tax=Thermus thermamylovorans TaxID=2509362 RepID=A0A4Q9B5X2_9DEIN|nr:YqhA family protein [Thermus thermamylovorans]TBH21449.1 YqhA family protein [Thermus thermamylovorans]